MEYKNYIEKKAKKLAEISRIEEGYAFIVKRFNPETGEPLSPAIETIDVDTLKQRKAELQEEIKSIDAILKEIKSL